VNLSFPWPIFRWVLVVGLIAGNATAASVQIGSSSFEIPTPSGYVEVTPEMKEVWRLLELTQASTHRLAYFIPKREAERALQGDTPSLKRAISVQTSRRLEQMTVTPEIFEEVKKQSQARIASQQTNELQAREFERMNGRIAATTEQGPRFEQLENVTLTPHVDLKDRLGFSELSLVESKAPDGTTLRSRSVTTTLSVLLRGKLLNCYVIGGADDLELTRSIASDWADALIALNK